jgi:hypothetical protein
MFRVLLQLVHDGSTMQLVKSDVAVALAREKGSAADASQVGVSGARRLEISRTATSHPQTRMSAFASAMTEGRSLSSQ